MSTYSGHKGLDPHMQELIRDSYKEYVTLIKCQEGRSPDNKVGVKQGNPMSPLLLNIALDPLIQKLENEGRGFATDSEPITAMAFADDLVILSNSLEGISNNLAILERFSKLTGMQVQPGKCHSIFINASGGRVTINNCPPWKLAGRPIHMIGPTESVRYLGIEINPWQGIFSGLGCTIQKLD